MPLDLNFIRDEMGRLADRRPAGHDAPNPLSLGTVIEILDRAIAAEALLAAIGDRQLADAFVTVHEKWGDACRVLSSIADAPSLDATLHALAAYRATKEPK